MRKMIKVLIDDMRELDGMNLVIRNYQSYLNTKETLLNNDFELYLDHDLGEEKSGYDVIKDLFESGIFPESIFVITMNPVGRKNIYDVLEYYHYRKSKNGNWIRLN